MSAFIVDDKTINEIVGIIHTSDFQYERKGINHVAFPEGENHELYGDPEELGKRLFALNVESVNQRYGEHQNFRDLNYKFQWQQPSIYQALKSVRCWLYQSCEGDCDQRRLYKAMDAFASALSHFIINTIPEYDKAEWR